MARNKVYALCKKDAIVIHDRDNILKVVEDFYAELYIPNAYIPNLYKSRNEDIHYKNNKFIHFSLWI